MFYSVHPILEYRILDPQSQEQAWKIKMVQRRAARFVMSDYTRTQDTVSSRRFTHWDGKSWMNGEHWQMSFYCIVSCTVLLRSHQHHYAYNYTQPHTYTLSFINLCSRRNVFQHSVPEASWAGGIVHVLPAYTRAATTLELEGTSCCTQNGLNAGTPFTCNMYILWKWNSQEELTFPATPWTAAHRHCTKYDSILLNG